jgi:radical SAM superfamily enzyme YgiQ (UPF0313 family)
MKILLVSVNNEKDPYPVAPLGAAYVAAAVKACGHEVRLLDLCFAEDDAGAIEDALKGFQPEVIGISIRNIDNLTYNRNVFYLPRIKNVVNFIKRRTSVPVVAGGSGFSIFPEEVLRFLGLEFGISGEGETAFTAFLDDMGKGGRNIQDIPNLCCLRDGEFRSNGRRYTDVKQKPDRGFLDNRVYLEQGGMANVQSKRGCPFHCTYCTYPAIEGNILRLKEPGAVVEEIKEMITDYGLDYVFFVDDIFNFPEPHAAEICETMLLSGLDISWACFATPKGMTPQLALLMKRAGCKGIEFGSDAGTKKTLNGLGKDFSTDDIRYAADCCRHISLPNAHYVIIGGPGEDPATIKETVSFFGKIAPTAVILLTGLRIYPNTQLHEMAVSHGVISRNRNLFEPIFYVSPEIDMDAVLQDISRHASCNRNWIVPSLNIGCDSNTLKLLRKMGLKGPLWDML